jgi:hypothetical protein
MAKPQIGDADLASPMPQYRAVPGRDGRATLETLTVDGRVGVDALDIPKLTVMLYRACGQEPPVMIGRPGLDSVRDADGWVSFRGLRVRRAAGGGVSFAIGGNTETLSEAMARQCAAVTVALADERADEEDLTALIRSEFPDSSDGDEEAMRAFDLIAERAAAKILADGRFGRTEGASHG